MDATGKEKLLEAVVCAMDHARLYFRLSKKEKFILPFIVSGDTNEVIAKRLGVAISTVKYRRGHIMSKLEVESFADLVRLAERLGIRPMR